MPTGSPPWTPKRDRCLHGDEYGDDNGDGRVRDAPLTSVAAFREYVRDRAILSLYQKRAFNHVSLDSSPT